MANCAGDELELTILLRYLEKQSQALRGRNLTRPFPISTGPGLRCANGASDPWKLLLPGVVLIVALDIGAMPKKIHAAKPHTCNDSASTDALAG